jgi:hypothetical protein
MRGLAVAILLSGCSHTPAPEAPAYGLDLNVVLAPAPPALAGLSVSAVRLHLVALSAISDRAATDARAQASSADVAFGETFDAPWPVAPPGLYSTVEWSLGDVATSGVDLQGALSGTPLHVQLDAGPMAARCGDPQTLAPGQRVRLTLTADATHWFDGVDLSTAMDDEDDNGIIINMEDNAPLAIQVLKNAIKSFQLECSTW